MDVNEQERKKEFITMEIYSTGTVKTERLQSQII
jgi:hypothetical protein